LKIDNWKLNEQASRLQGTYRAVVIGDTARGGYGHGLDVAFVGLPGVQIVAVADPDAAGRQRALERSGAERGYADYREMLARETMDLVAVGPTWLDQREPMVVAAANAGVKAIYCEKPLARSLEEADRMLAACDARGVKIGVAHQNRAFPAPYAARELIAAGKIGRLRAMRAYSKQDSRAGGLELLIHGTHMFDLMRLFAGDARWCNARVAQDGHDLIPAELVPASDAWGLIAGDDIVAQYGFDHGILGTFETVRYDDGGGTPYFCMELCGTAGLLTFWSDLRSPLYYHPYPQALPDRAGEWRDVRPGHSALRTPHSNGLHIGNQALVGDLLAAVEAGRPPVSSGHDGRAALEMIMAAYESHIQQERVRLPLEQREHPLSRWAG
jgi:predicted dehydrogenase